MSESVVFLLPGFSDMGKMAEKVIECEKKSHPEQSGCVIQARKGAVEPFRMTKNDSPRGDDERM